jgi:hypothetical protein
LSPHGIFEGRTTHRVKSWPQHFEAAISGRKVFEVRRDDRSPPYQTGDLVLLQEWRPVDEGPEREPGYTKRQALFLIGYVSRGPAMPDGFCAFEIIAPELAMRVGAAVIAPRRAAVVRDIAAIASHKEPG